MRKEAFELKKLRTRLYTKKLAYKSHCSYKSVQLRGYEIRELIEQKALRKVIPQWRKYLVSSPKSEHLKHPKYTVPEIFIKSN